MTIGQLYNANNVVVGQAVCYFAPANTPLPADNNNSVNAFDPTNWSGQTVTVGAATAGTFTLTVGGQTTAPIAYNATAAAVKTAIEALSSVGAGNSIVTSTTPGTWTITLVGSAAGQSITGTGTGLTGGAFSKTASGLWVPVGATEQGWKITTNKSTQDHQVEEQSTPVAQTVQSQKLTIDGDLSEDVTQTIALAFNMTSAVTAAGTGQPGKTRLTLTDTPLQYAVVLEAVNKFGFARRTYIPVATALTNSSVDFRRSASKRHYPLQFTSICPMNQIVVDEYTAAGQ